MFISDADENLLYYKINVMLSERIYFLSTCSVNVTPIFCVIFWTYECKHQKQLYDKLLSHFDICIYIPGESLHLRKRCAKH